MRCVGGYTFDAATDLLDLLSISRILPPVLAGADPIGMARSVKQAIAITDNGAPLKTKIRKSIFDHSENQTTEDEDACAANQQRRRHMDAADIKTHALRHNLDTHIWGAYMSSCTCDCYSPINKVYLQPQTQASARFLTIKSGDFT